MALKAVTITVGRFEESGIGNIVRNLCANLVARHYSVSVGVLTAKYVLTDVPMGCNTFHFTNHLMLSRLLGHIIMTPDCMPNFIGEIVHHHQSSLILKSLPFGRKKVILHYHGANPQFEENPRVAYEARQIQKHAPKAAAIITVSQFAKRELQELFNVKSEIDVVHPGVDTQHYTTEVPAKYRRGKPSFLFVGELVKKKGVNRLIDAMSLVRKEHPDAFLRIIGRGRRLPELQEQVQRLSLEKNVEIISSWVPRSELPFYYASCDVYVSSSIWEGLALPVLEALACGKPVVGPSGSSYEEVIDESSAGRAFEAGNSEDLANMMVMTTDDADKYKETARTYALKHSWPNITDAIERVYQRVCQS
ncbi:MAG: glycosyltransferase family 4 protein [Candidatus Bathyarchaeia archaeon]